MPYKCSKLAASPIPCGTEMGTGGFCLPVYDPHDVDTSTTGIRPVKRIPYATGEAWDCMRATITRLYQSEGSSLKEVKGTMERDHSFYATERMFKTRIVQWGLNKKLNEKEVMHMLRLKRQRQAAGKDSSFKVRGQNVNWDRIEQYLKRRPDLETKQHALSHNASELEITCQTPSPILNTMAELPCIPSLLDPTLEVDLQEDIMRVFARYHTGAFESGLWVSDDTNLCEHGFVHLLETLNNIGNVPKLFKLNQTDAGFRALRHGLQSVRYLLQTREPRFYYCMLLKILHLKDDVRESTVHLIHRIHQEILGDQHPLSIIWNKLKGTPQGLRLEALRNIFSMISLHIEDEHAHKSQHVLDVLRVRCSLLRILKVVDGNEFQQIISSHAAAAADSFDKGNYGSSCRILLGLAIAQLDAGRIGQAEATLARIGSLVKDKFSGSGKSQWLDKQQEDHCSTSALCSSKRRYEKSTGYSKIIYGYYKGHWEPWSKWSPAAVEMIINAHRGAGDEGAAHAWFDVLLAMN